MSLSRKGTASKASGPGLRRVFTTSMSPLPSLYYRGSTPLSTWVMACSRHSAATATAEEASSHAATKPFASCPATAGRARSRS